VENADRRKKRDWLWCGGLRKIENRKLLGNGLMAGWMDGWGTCTWLYAMNVKKVLVCNMLNIVQLFKLLYVILLPLIFD